MVTLTTRRQFVAGAPAILGGSAILSGCSRGPDAEGYEAVARQTWRPGALDGFEGGALSTELVRYATLAPSSHNTQCWKFAVVDKAITILPAGSERHHCRPIVTRQRRTARRHLRWLPWPARPRR